MGLLLTLTPPILILLDSVTGSLLSAFDESAMRRLSAADVANIHSFMFGTDGDFDKLTHMSTACSGEISLLQTINSNIQLGLDKINAAGEDDNYGIIKTYFINTQTDINKCLEYINSGAQTDRDTLLGIVNT
jgi:hypothetical protein